MKISIIGAGAWGTALAIHFVKYHKVVLYTRNGTLLKELIEFQENIKYLPHFKLDKSIIVKFLPIHQDFDSDLIILATPVAGIRDTLLTNKDYLSDIPLLIASKGFEKNTNLLPFHLAKEIYPLNTTIGLLSGPSFAQELAQGLPCAVCLSSENKLWITNITKELNSPIMRLYANTDPIGVGVGGAVKNIIAIATGVIDGLHYGLNARAALITRGLAELKRLALALGAQESTLMGLAGIGDLILTSTGSLSRNRTVGIKLAEGKSTSTILKELGHVAEGVNTINEVLTLSKNYNINMPITETLKNLLDNKLSAKKAVELLMLREPKFE